MLRHREGLGSEPVIERVAIKTDCPWGQLHARNAPLVGPPVNRASIHPEDGSDLRRPNIVDDHSRLLVASHARGVTKGGDVVASFHEAFAAQGLPASVLTDNAAVFTGTPRGGGRCAIEIEMGLLGIRYHHSSPYHPQTCGKVERFHQTLKKWLSRQPRPVSVEELQAQLDRFRGYYNSEIPHRALGRRTPLEAFLARPKATPAGSGFDVPKHFRVRKDKVDKIGRVTLRYNSRLYHVGLGRAHKGKKVLILVADRGPGDHRGWRGSEEADPGPEPGLPAAGMRWKDVPRHLCTMSRDITHRAPGRIRTCAPRSGGECSIP
jgi:integrase-like protein